MYGHTSGVFFHGSENTWMPIMSCCQQAIPEDLPTAARDIVRCRDICKDVSFDESGFPKIDKDGFMTGNDCRPTIDDVCLCDCGRRWADAVLEDCGHFILRTYSGAVMRVKKKAVCTCGHELKWNPATEFIHTIDSDCEGGNNFLNSL